MYAGGLPILYPIGCLSFAVLYWVYKFLLLRYYQKTTMFNEDLAVFSLRLVKLGLLWHLFITAFMYSNSKILSSAAQQGSDIYSAFLSGLSSSGSSSFKDILI